MARRRGKDSGKRATAGTPPKYSPSQQFKRVRDERPKEEKQRFNDPDAIQRDALKSH